MGLGKTLCVISLIIRDLLQRRERRENAILGGESEKGKEKETDGTAPAEKVSQGNTEETEDTCEDKKDTEDSEEKEQESDIPDEDLILVEEDCSQSKHGETADESEDEDKPTLIVCPLSVLSNWETQLKQHLRPEFPISVYVYHGKNRSSEANFLKKHDVVLTTYNILGNEWNEHAIDEDDGADENEEGRSGNKNNSKGKKIDSEMLYTNLFHAFAPAFSSFPLPQPAPMDSSAPSNANLQSPLQQVQWSRYTYDITWLSDNLTFFF